MRIFRTEISEPRKQVLSSFCHSSRTCIVISVQIVERKTLFFYFLLGSRVGAPEPHREFFSVWPSIRESNKKITIYIMRVCVHIQNTLYTTELAYEQG